MSELEAIKHSNYMIIRFKENSEKNELLNTGNLFIRLLVVLC